MSESHVTELRAEIERLTARLDAIEAGETGETGEAVEPPCSDESTGRVSRRQWVRAAAAAAAGGTAAVVAGRPAAAAAGSPLTLGQANTTATATRSDYTGPAEGVGMLFQSGNSFNTGSAEKGAAVGAMTTNALQPNGLYGYSTVDAADTVVGVDAVLAGAAGVVGHATGDGSIGVRAMSDQSSGLRSDGATYGAEISGELAAMVLGPTTFVPPTSSTEFHRGGEFYVRAASDSGLAVELWFCTVGGTPGTWVQVAGPGQPGAFRAIDPVRAYDSRSAQPAPGVLSAGSKRVVDLTQSRDLTTGAPTGPLVPEGATAVAYNVAVVNTTGSGFLSVVPGASATSFSAATVNWSATGQILNNGSIVRVFSDREVSVFAGGSGSTHFVIDVTGYWV